MPENIKAVKHSDPFGPVTPRGEEWVQDQLDRIVSRAVYQAMIWNERADAARKVLGAVRSGEYNRG